jgi:hypothetical protein
VVEDKEAQDQPGATIGTASLLPQHDLGLSRYGSGCLGLRAEGDLTRGHVTQPASGNPSAVQAAANPRLPLADIRAVAYKLR